MSEISSDSCVTWINGRPAADFEAQAVRRGYECARQRDLVLLAGVLGAGTRPAPETVAGRRVDDVGMEWLT